MISIFNQYVSGRTLILAATEMGMICLAVLGGLRIRFWNDPFAFSFYTAWPAFQVQLAVITAVFGTCFYYNGLYDLTLVRTRREHIIRLTQSLGAGCLLLSLVYFMIPGLLLGRGVLALFILNGACLLLVTRIVLDRTWRAVGAEQTVLVVGTQQAAQEFARELAGRSDLNMRLAGFVSETRDGNRRELAGYPIFGCAADVSAVARSKHAQRIVVALEERRGVLPVRELVTLRVQGVVVEDVCSALAGLTGRVPLRILPPSWFAFSDGFHRSRSTLAAKRAIDILFSLTGLALCAPAMLLIAVAIRLDSKGPAIYTQRRVGYRRKCFNVLKFRSMQVGAEPNGAQWAKPGDPRITRIGKWLRKFRLDELPQFVNVLRGDMSFVGPRPERPEFVEELVKLIPYYDERHSVRPGLTGWAQVRYPYGSSVEDAVRKLEYDLFYLKNLSILFDSAIVATTVRIVFSGKGA